MKGFLPDGITRTRSSPILEYVQFVPAGSPRPPEWIDRKVWEINSSGLAETMVLCCLRRRAKRSFLHRQRIQFPSHSGTPRFCEPSVAQLPRRKL